MEFTYSILAIIALASSASAAGWTYYNGPDGDYAPADWATHYADACAGDSNSPIDLTGAVKNDDVSTSWTLTGWDSTSGTLEVVNNGHSLKLTPSDTRTTVGGSLPGTYQMLQFHLHWGSELGRGSEHTVDGTSYEAELHFVHWKTEYDNTTHAMTHSDGLAVLGVFFEEGDTDNAALTAILDAVDDVSYPQNGTVDINGMDLTSLLPSNTEDFYRYDGGLTTPSCNEIVVWTVFKNPISISTAQMEKLRTLMFMSNGDTLTNNYRPVQAIGTRTLHKTFDDEESSSAAKPVFGVLAVLLAALVNYL